MTINMVLPLLMSFAAFFAFFFVIGKAFCGWVCPLGTLQELIGKIGRRFGIGARRFEQGDLGAAKRVRPVKWLILLGLVFLLPLLTGLGVTPHSMGNPYCDICPSRVATTSLQDRRCATLRSKSKISRCRMKCRWASGSSSSKTDEGRA